MFRFLKEQFTKLYTQVTSRLQSLFGSQPVDETTLHELEKILLEADTGVVLARKLIDDIHKEIKTGKVQAGTDLQKFLEKKLLEILNNYPYRKTGSIYLLVGINGTGKTTFAAKLAHYWRTQGKKVLLVAADTFRAAATDQLRIWAERSGADYITGNPGQDPASVVFAGIEKYSKNTYDVLIIDTAGRLQTKTNLMKELEKIRRVITKQVSEEQIITLLTIDALLGQNSFDQARLFNQATPLDGIVLTKMDGTGKGGIVFAITHELNIPIAYISYGEKQEHMAPFNPDTYIHDLLYQQ